ncbi:MAG: type II toxin-antitoxin system PemK/MazF family toxin [Gammaproteobacteria bacterium]|nr:type II toxin-antitoxin system PemK/MazF family toxin [Gammaproteobacteria bacterium]
MRRGDIVTVAAPGDYGKPRPAVVIQGDPLNQAEPRSTIVALITSAVQDAPLLRLTVEPTPGNGLRVTSQVQVNRIVTAPVAKISSSIGQLTDQQLVEMNRLLAVVIGLG